NDNKAFDKVLKEFSVLAKKLSDTAKNKTEVTVSPVSGDATAELNAEKIKQQSLSQFVLDLKKSQPGNKKLQSVQLSDTHPESEPVLLAQAISQLINLTSDVSPGSAANEVIYDAESLPKMREVFIQILEQMVVPVALLSKVEKLKAYLETGEDKDWQLSLKKLVQFINEVRFQQYQEEGEYEDFLQEVTNRLQEMVQFLADENREIESSKKKGSEINRAVTEEVDGLRQGLETAATLDALQSVVNNRLDAISGFMLQHSQLEKDRFDSAKDSLSQMQEKINLLESETAELKVSLAEKSREAMYDALTEIPNRLFYEKRIKEDIARWQRFGTPLSIAIWDVDKFKA
ncbi:MAG: diguanylate cyclase, partial [Gammaproteobacteria bacterium]|nr:diguanylate cyclase [Gammaproteobacteria bacterium]